MALLPSWNQPRVIRLAEVTRFAEDHFINAHLFDGDGFYGRLLCFRQGQHVPEHMHPHMDECFDVVEGEGSLWLNGQQVRAGPGTTFYIAAGTRHALVADGTEYWVLRETVHERVYARRALRLLARMILKRLPWIGRHWR